MSGIAPPCARPQHVPDLRLWLLDQWRPTGPFTRSAISAAVDMRTVRGRPDMTPTEPSWDENALRHASLWWVSADMVTLLEHAAAQLPDDVELTADMLPDPDALVVLERSLLGHDADPNRDPTDLVRVDALCWAPCNVLAPRNAPAVSVQSYERLSLHEGLSSTQLTRGTETGALDAVEAALRASHEREAVFTRGGREGDTWAWLGRSDWCFGDKITDPIVPSVEPQRHASHVEDRRWLAALWLLSKQARLAETVDHEPDRPARRRSERADVTSTVRIVDLRRPRHEPVEHEPSNGHRHVDWSCQWIVGGDEGFWRWQACGPGRTQRERIYIAPFVKGPPGKPLRIRKTVKVVK